MRRTVVHIGGKVLDVALCVLAYFLIRKPKLPSDTRHIPKTMDFTEPTQWGRALHTSTMRTVEPVGWEERFADWYMEASRWRVMCHYPVAPRAEDTVVWEAETHYVRAEIIHVKDCWDPKDMYVLTCRVTPASRIPKLENNGEQP